MENPIRFKDNQDRLLSDHEKNKAIAWIEGHLDDIVRTHKKLVNRRGLNTSDLNLLDILLHTVVSNIFHDKAEQEFFMRRCGYNNEEDKAE
jgi:hypothetical protein